MTEHHPRRLPSSPPFRRTGLQWFETASTRSAVETFASRDAEENSTRRLSSSVMHRNLKAEVCVGAAIFRGGKLLLIRRAPSVTAFPGTWDLAGGHVEEGEDILDALRREVREETGFSVSIGRPFYACNWKYPRGGGRSSPTVEVDFLCSVRSTGPPRLDPSEHTESAWIQHYDPARHPAPTLLRKIIRAALADRSALT